MGCNFARFWKKLITFLKILVKFCQHLTRAWRTESKKKHHGCNFFFKFFVDFFSKFGKKIQTFQEIFNFICNFRCHFAAISGVFAAKPAVILRDFDKSLQILEFFEQNVNKNFTQACEIQN